MFFYDDLIVFYRAQPVLTGIVSHIAGGCNSYLHCQVSLDNSGWTELHILRFGHQRNMQTILMSQYKTES